MKTTRRRMTTVVSVILASIAIFAGTSSALAATPTTSSASASASHDVGTTPAGCTARSYKIWGDNCAGLKIDVVNDSTSSVTYTKSAADGVASISRSTLAPSSSTAVLTSVGSPLGPGGVDAAFHVSSDSNLIGYFIYTTVDYAGHTTVDCGSIELEQGMPTHAPGQHCNVVAAGQRDADGTVHLANPAETIGVSFN